MALAYVLDEHLRGPLWRAVQRHNARGSNPIDVARVGDANGPPLGATDPEILLWAEQAGRVLITFDEQWTGSLRRRGGDLTLLDFPRSDRGLSARVIMGCYVRIFVSRIR